MSRYSKTLLRKGESKRLRPPGPANGGDNPGGDAEGTAVGPEVQALLWGEGESACRSRRSRQEYRR
jgi:hypothetical protein